MHPPGKNALGDIFDRLPNANQQTENAQIWTGQPHSNQFGPAIDHRQARYQGHNFAGQPGMGPTLGPSVGLQPRGLMNSGDLLVQQFLLENIQKQRGKPSIGFEKV